MEHKYPIPEQDIEAILYANDNLKIDDVADRIVKTLINNCKRQVKDMMIDNKKVLPILPVLATDSNLRSIKEFHQDGWKATQSNKGEHMQSPNRDSSNNNHDSNRKKTRSLHATVAPKIWSWEQSYEYFGENYY